MPDGSISGTGQYLIANWTDPTAEALLVSLSADWGSRLLVPALWRKILPQAGLLVSSAISGGELQARFQSLPVQRCWLLDDPVSMEFPLPCPDGQGSSIADIPPLKSFYSPALCCRYAHEPGKLYLFDTPETIAKKQLLARQCGFCGHVALKNPPGQSSPGG